MSTRLYFDSTTNPFMPPGATPVFNASWNNTGSAGRFRLLRQKRSGDSLSNQSITMNAGDNCLFRQYISDLLGPGNFFNTSTTYKCYLRAFESNADDNLGSGFAVRVQKMGASAQGGTVLVCCGPYVNTEFNPSTLRNKSWADGDVGTGTVTTQGGERLIVEIGTLDLGGGATPSATINFGADLSLGDLPENETDTTALNPWFECSLDLKFLDPQQHLMGVGSI